MVVKTDEKYSDGSIKYWHACSKCGKESGYLGRRTKLVGYCKDCLAALRVESIKKANEKLKETKRVNKFLATKWVTEGISKESVQEIFKYLPEGVLVFRDTFGIKMIKNQVAGSIDSEGSRVVGINGKKYSVAYLIWVYHHGVPEKSEISRANRITHDTRIENLQTDRSVLSNWEFIRRAIEKHGYKYDYSNTQYTHNTNAVKIICREHGEFEQEAHMHLLGHGCQKCAVSGFKKDKPATLYYIRIAGANVYKIGITNNSVNDRFLARDLDNIEIIKEWYYENGEEAYAREQKILQEFRDYRYSGDPILSSGNSEMFTIDVLGLDVL